MANINNYEYFKIVKAPDFISSDYKNNCEVMNMLICLIQSFHIVNI